MLKPYNLLEGVLNDIETGIKDNINECTLCEKYSLSYVHLRRLFKFAFRRTIGAYIRSRKLAASIEELLFTDLNVIDIAMEYGIEYEASYIRAFKREFGLTPGELRKTRQILKITPPLQLFDSNRIEDGAFFGPDIVMIPQFHVAGIERKLNFRSTIASCGQSKEEKLFCRERGLIPNAVNPDVHINISREAEPDSDFCYSMPSVQVKSLDDVPEGFNHYTFPTSLCARFRFIGLVGDEINMIAGDRMYRAIDDFMDDEKQKYFLERKRVNIDRFSMDCDGIYQLWEWFTPVILKSESEAPKYEPGIIKTYRQEIPALRFIGKKFTEPFNGSKPLVGSKPQEDSPFKKMLDNMRKWIWHSQFDIIEKQYDKNPGNIYEGGDSYISLVKETHGITGEYWLGMLMPEGTIVPEGYEMIDFPKSTLGVCRVYGKKDAIIHYDADCRKKLAQEGICQASETGAKWFFQRFNWRWFFEEDKYGKRFLEYCYFL